MWSAVVRLQQIKKEQEFPMGAFEIFKVSRHMEGKLTYIFKPIGLMNQAGLLHTLLLDVAKCMMRSSGPTLWCNRGQCWFMSRTCLCFVHHWSLFLIIHMLHLYGWGSGETEECSSRAANQRPCVHACSSRSRGHEVWTDGSSGRHTPLH